MGNNTFVTVVCHFESCNINDDKLIVLSPTLRSILFDLFMELKASSNSFCPSLINANNRSQILLQLYLSNNQIESYGLITLLNLLSFPIIYVEYLSLNNNPTNEIAAFYINNYLEKCLVLPHRIHLCNTEMRNNGINCIIKGMIKRKDMIAHRLIELEHKLKAMNYNDNDNEDDIIICGVAINDEDKDKLYVPMAITVDRSIDIESLALNATRHIFVCTGADYKYIGHGECDENYCAVTATICTEDGNVNKTTLPLIHLFIHETYLSLVIADRDTLNYLLYQEWNINTEKPPHKLVDQFYAFCYYLRLKLPIDIDELNNLLLKILKTTTLNIDKAKVFCLAKEILNIKYNDADKYYMEIKKYIAQNKEMPFSLNKWKQIIKTKIKCNDSKLVDSLAKYAANLIQTKWSVQKELLNIVSSNYISFLLLKNKHQSVMEFILNEYSQQCFGLKQNKSQCVTFCIQKSLMDKYKSNIILNQCLDAQILQSVDNIHHINDDDIIILNTTNILELHQKLFISVHQELWDRSFFDCLYKTTDL